MKLASAARRAANHLATRPRQERLEIIRSRRRPEEVPVEGLLELAEHEQSFDRWAATINEPQEG